MRPGPPLHVSEIVRFVIVGSLATLVHFVVLTLAVEHRGISPPIANGIAFLCAVGVTFAGQSFWVFRGHGRVTMAKIVRFMCSLAIGFSANLTVMAISTRIFALDYRIGFLVSVAFVTLLSFVVNKLWVFGRVSA